MEFKHTCTCHLYKISGIYVINSEIYIYIYIYAWWHQQKDANIYMEVSSTYYTKKRMHIYIRIHHRQKDEYLSTFGPPVDSRDQLRITRVFTYKSNHIYIYTHKYIHILNIIICTLRKNFNKRRRWYNHVVAIILANWHIFATIFNAEIGGEGVFVYIYIRIYIHIYISLVCAY